MTTRADIDRIARSNPIVRAALTEVQRGEMTFDEAMLVCVEFLANQNKTLICQSLDSYARRPIKIDIPLDSITAAMRHVITEIALILANCDRSPGHRLDKIQQLIDGLPPIYNPPPQQGKTNEPRQDSKRAP